MNQNSEKKTELLAPAGSFHILKAVVQAGADAVYAASSQFGARAYATNFTTEEFIEAIDYSHLRGKKLYLTLNTLLKDCEVEELLYEYLLPFYEAGLDGVIVQDLGVMRFIQDTFPLLPIHASTQMTITGALGAQLLLDAGCSRIVTARELSLNEIAEIYQKTHAEIETFVHGALCYCYSGQCLFSSILGGRSGNRGRCAQPCRLPYGWSKDGKNFSQKEEYLLSPKDLCAIDLIPQMIQSGVHSFKIEGRMKQAEYAAGVTKIYRHYLDYYEADPSAFYEVSKEDHEKLLWLGNRSGFTQGYLTQYNGKNMITKNKPSHEKGTELPTSVEPLLRVDMESKEKIKGILILSKDFPARLMIEYKEISLEVMGEIVQQAQKQPMKEETIREKMQKTGNTPFQFESLEIKMESDIFIPVGGLNQLRRQALDELFQKLMTPYQRTSCTFDSTKHPIKENSKISSVSEKESLRILVETKEQLAFALKVPEAERIYLEQFICSRDQFVLELTQWVHKIHTQNKECYLAMPYVLRSASASWFQKVFPSLSKIGVDGFLIRNLEELQLLKNNGIPAAQIQADYGLYSFSNLSVQKLSQLGIMQLTLPVELNVHELQEHSCRESELIIYGRQPLMLSAQCLWKNTEGCTKIPEIHYLKDRYHKLFPIKNRCEDCYNIIYNTSPLSLFHHGKTIQSLGVLGVRISFTTEGEEEMRQAITYYRQSFLQDNVLKKESYWKDFTNGHFKRGVE
ncbi:MAG: DUF3656 domain-containing protein [Lachnospiraceae bacterium]